VYQPAGLGSWSGQLETITDYVHQDFGGRSRKGEVILSDMSLYRGSRQGLSGAATFGPHPLWGSRECWGDAAGFLEYASGNSDVNANSALSIAQLLSETCLVSAYAKMNQASMSGLETVKDLGETIRMLRRPFHGGIELLKKMEIFKRRRLGKTVSSALRATKESWLEYRYGWKPLLLDCDEVIKFAHRKREKCDRLRLVSRAGGSKELDGVADLTVPTSLYSGPNGVTQVTGKTRYQKTVRVGAGVIYDMVSHSTTDDLNRLLGTRPSDLPLGVWECIPFSFVADWFVNVGEWLSAVTPNPSVRVRGNWATYVIETTDTTFDVNVSLYVASPPATTYNRSFPGSVRKSTTVVRKVNLSVPSYPTLTFRPLSALHAADAVALGLDTLMSMLRGFRH
jgi:hypothetical protein